MKERIQEKFIQNCSTHNLILDNPFPAIAEFEDGKIEKYFTDGSLCEACCQIKICFDVPKSKEFFVQVMKVQLFDEDNKQLTNCRPYETWPNGFFFSKVPQIKFWFKCKHLLSNNARFVIVMKMKKMKQYKKYEFVLNNDQWIVEAGGSASCPA